MSILRAQVDFCLKNIFKSYILSCWNRATRAAQQGRYNMITDLFTVRESRDPMSYFTGEEGNVTMDELYLSTAHDKYDLIVQ